jgi:hypothetical protein
MAVFVSGFTFLRNIVALGYPVVTPTLQAGGFPCGHPVRDHAAKEDYRAMLYDTMDETLLEMERLP